MCSIMQTVISLFIFCLIINGVNNRYLVDDGWLATDVEGMVAYIRQYSDESTFNRLRPDHDGMHCHDVDESVDSECHAHEQWPWKNHVVLPFESAVVHTFESALPFAAADDLPTMQVRCTDGLSAYPQCPCGAFDRTSAGVRGCIRQAERSRHTS